MGALRVTKECKACDDGMQSVRRMGVYLVVDGYLAGVGQMLCECLLYALLMAESGRCLLSF